MSDAMRNHECSLCGLQFAGEGCRSICPMSRGCNMVRCPRCGFEFVDESAVLNLFRRIFKRRSPEAGGAEATPGGDR